MEALDLIYNRKSIRRFSSQPIREEVVHKIMRAGQAGPCCVNAREFCFFVTQDKDKMFNMFQACGSPSAPLKDSTLAIVVCGDMDKAFEPAKDYWIIDCAIAAQNICLSAYSLGLGNVWLGVYPQMERVSNLAALLELPKNVIPHSIIALGYPEEDDDMKPLTEEELNEKYNPELIHYENW